MTTTIFHALLQSVGEVGHHSFQDVVRDRTIALLPKFITYKDKPFPSGSPTDKNKTETDLENMQAMECHLGAC